MSFTPSPQQAAAIQAIVTWYRDPHRGSQVFRLFGCAGSGKSTITSHAIDALGLTAASRDNVGGGVLFAAFTGKAALVMTRKGTPASTIHSLIYRVRRRHPRRSKGWRRKRLNSARASAVCHQPSRCSR